MTQLYIVTTGIFEDTVFAGELNHEKTHVNNLETVGQSYPIDNVESLGDDDDDNEIFDEQDIFDMCN